MKNITLSADEDKIEQARAFARAHRTTLNQLFRDWLNDTAEGKSIAQSIAEMYARLDYVNSGGRKYSRDEMNER